MDAIATERKEPRTETEHEAIMERLATIVKPKTRYIGDYEGQTPQKTHEWKYVIENQRGTYKLPTRYNDAIGLVKAFERQLEIHYGQDAVPKELKPVARKDTSGSGHQYNCRIEGFFIVPEALTENDALMKQLENNRVDIFHDASSHAGRRARG